MFCEGFFCQHLVVLRRRRRICDRIIEKSDIRTANPYVKVSDWGCIDVVSFTTGELAKRYGFIYVDLNYDGTRPDSSKTLKTKK